MVFSLIWFSNSKFHWKFFTSQERCTLYLEVSKEFISLAPFLPWMNDSQLFLTPIPTGVTNPNPVITIFDIVFVFKLGLRQLFQCSANFSSLTSLCELKFALLLQLLNFLALKQERTTIH